MILRKVTINGKTYFYEHEVKNVKNINLSVNREKTIRVSANRRVPIRIIEEFIAKNESFLIRALSKMDRVGDGLLKETPTKKDIENLDVKVKEFIDKYYPFFEQKGVVYPKIKYRKMTSRWGSCHYKDGKIVFNSYLSLLDGDLIEYVVVHELCHFIVPDHSKQFYANVERLLPDYKQRRKRLKSIVI